MTAGYPERQEGWPTILPHRAVITADVSVAGQAYASQATLRGWSVRESTGLAIAQLDLFDGLAASGVLVATITLKAGESTRDYLPGGGVSLQRGLWVVLTAGAVAGVAWIEPQ